VNIQLNAITCSTYPENLYIRDNVVAPFVLVSIVIVTLPLYSACTRLKFCSVRPTYGLIRRGYGKEQLMVRIRVGIIRVRVSSSLELGCGSCQTGPDPHSGARDHQCILCLLTLPRLIPRWVPSSLGRCPPDSSTGRCRPENSCVLLPAVERCLLPPSGSGMHWRIQREGQEVHPTPKWIFGIWIVFAQKYSSSSVLLYTHYIINFVQGDVKIVH